MKNFLITTGLLMALLLSGCQGMGRNNKQVHAYLKNGGLPVHTDQSGDTNG